MEPTTAGALIGAAGNLFGGNGGGQALPNSSGVYGAPVNVSVGGLNVPAFPNFPTKMTATQGVIAASNANNNMILMAGGLIVAVIILKKFVK